MLFFPLALHDINSVFQFPSAIFGREHEIELLRAAILRSAQREYDQVSSTTTPTRISSPLDKPLSEVIVITGPGGIGMITWHIMICMLCNQSMMIQANPP